MLRQELLVILELGPGRARRAIDDLFAVAGEEGAAIVAGSVRQAHDVLAVGVHAVELEIAIARRGEDDRAVEGADRRLGIVGVVVGQLRELAAIGLLRGPVVRANGAAGGVSGEDLVAAVDRPGIAVRAIRRRWAVGRGEVGRGIEEALAVGKEVGASRLALARRQQGRSRAVDRQRVDLVALVRRPGGLERELQPVLGPVGLRILAAEGELADVGEVRFARVVELDGSGYRCAGWRGRLSPRAGGAAECEDEAGAESDCRSTRGCFRGHELGNPSGCETLSLRQAI